MIARFASVIVLCLSLSCASETGVEATGRLAEIQANLTKDLTPSRAETRFGKPDDVTGSGLLIYVYDVGDGDSLWLFFPGYAPIMRAALRDGAGELRELPIR